MVKLCPDNKPWDPVVVTVAIPLEGVYIIEETTETLPVGIKDACEDAVTPIPDVDGEVTEDADDTIISFVFPDSIWVIL